MALFMLLERKEDGEQLRGIKMAGRCCLPAMTLRFINLQDCGRSVGSCGIPAGCCPAGIAQIILGSDSWNSSDEGNVLYW